jgi:hypothetical protein
VDIEDGIEQYYRNLIADEIDDCLYNNRLEDEEEILKSRWFNEGMKYAGMIARFGLM